MAAINREWGWEDFREKKKRRKTKRLTTENETSALGRANPEPIPQLQLSGKSTTDQPKLSSRDGVINPHK